MSLSSPESVECELGRSISLHRISLGYLHFCVSVCVCGGCQGFLFLFVLFVFRIQNCTPILGYLASLRRLGRNLGLFLKRSFFKTFVIAFLHCSVMLILKKSLP